MLKCPWCECDQLKWGQLSCPECDRDLAEYWPTLSRPAVEQETPFDPFAQSAAAAAPAPEAAALDLDFMNPSPATPPVKAPPAPKALCPTCQAALETDSRF